MLVCPAHRWAGWSTPVATITPQLARVVLDTGAVREYRFATMSDVKSRLQARVGAFADLLESHIRAAVIEFLREGPAPVQAARVAPKSRKPPVAPAPVRQKPRPKPVVVAAPVTPAPTPEPMPEAAPVPVVAPLSSPLPEPVPAAPPAPVVTGPVPVRLPARPAPHSIEKRSPQEIEASAQSVAQYVALNPGQSVEQIAQGLHTSTKDLTLPIRKLLSAGTLKTEGAAASHPLLHRDSPSGAARDVWH